MNEEKLSWSRPQSSTLDRSKYMFKQPHVQTNNSSERFRMYSRISSAGPGGRRISSLSAGPGRPLSGVDGVGRTRVTLSSHERESACNAETVTVNQGEDSTGNKSTNASESQDSVEQSADQSNRPSAIADLFLSLYKNEWRLALDTLKSQAVMEQTAIQCLLYVLMEAYRSCLSEANIQVKEFENAALNIITNGRYTFVDKSKLGDSGNIKHMVEYRKEVADLALKRLQQRFLGRTLPIIHRRYGIKHEESLSRYAQQAVAVGWRLAIQDPVFVLDPAVEQYAELDTSVYEPYKASEGSRMCNLVWPVLRLYDKGPVLCKGIVHCFGNKA